MNSHRNGSNVYVPLNHFKHTYNEGFSAAQLGLSKDNCLYNPGTIQFVAWHKGFQTAVDMENDLNDEERWGDRILVALIIVIVCVGAGVLLFSRS